VLVASVAGFVALSHGAAFGTLPVTGFAEGVNRAIAPLSTGRIVDVKVTLGQEVKAGDILAELDRRQLEARRDSLLASVEKARAQLEAQRGIQDLQVMRAELWALRARADEQGARAELGALEKQMQTLDTLSSEHLVSALDVVEAMRQKQSLDARVGMYDEALKRGQAGLDGRAGALRESRAHAVATRLGPYEQAVHTAEADLKQAEIAIEEMTLRAPIDGRIGAILHRSGEVLSAGTEIITLVSGRPGAIHVTAPEKISAQLTPGAKVKVRRAGVFRRAVEGTVIELSPGIDQAPQRSWTSPSAPMWGRRVVVQAANLAELLPGEAVYVQF
jgi:HlyD family secretion protein